ncbi:MAG: TauD/TfdA family dioxygenase, partial [Proteobacteria bacterium]|nr:TauD/TfdA family dioxygenase [Pseudomonadota bacterium]
MLDIRELGIGPCKFLEKRRAELAGLRFERIQAAPLSPTIGAELRGVDLANLDDETFAEIERAFLEYKVIFFRDQDISTEQHLSFAQRFGELEEHPFIKAKDGYGEIVSFEKDEKVVGVENIWHSDVSWREVPSLGSVLRARAVPEVGGDTLWSDMEAAYQGLPDDLKQRIDGLRAIHDFSQSFGI